MFFPHAVRVGVSRALVGGAHVADHIAQPSLRPAARYTSKTVMSSTTAPPSSLIQRSHASFAKRSAAC
eukprot:CAMPEP_0170449316 /NCGR_PEP_ID=MMETSP0117_2-20130122/51183_1 /TAXON_ID=400756 /ORGANISM="Durinskia baltica, Strain CSIRO CS-38" /LENGTH=67 /DNA_ID=CAMNT_0010710557 /DNA_START=32 /DNA_END=232 /DNA_ORIENTATION=-